MAVKQLKEDKLSSCTRRRDFRRRSSHGSKTTTKKRNYVPLLGNEFSQEEVHMAVKQLKEDKL